MTTLSRVQSSLLTAIMVAGFTIPALADNMVLQPVREGNATYVSGGIGADEQQALEASANNYNLQITNANEVGQYTTDTNFQITSKDGREMISVDGAGPLFYAKLPAGEYVVRATNGDQHTVRDVKVSAHKPTDMHMIWKQG